MWDLKHQQMLKNVRKGWDKYLSIEEKFQRTVKHSSKNCDKNPKRHKEYYSEGELRWLNLLIRQCLFFSHLFWTEQGQHVLLRNWKDVGNLTFVKAYVKGGFQDHSFLGSFMAKQQENCLFYLKILDCICSKIVEQLGNA